jgi:DNA-binding response OmpR family regulator
MRVLIVEDNPLLALDLAEEVRAAGGEVVGIAEAGGEGARLLVLLKPDVALLDVELADDVPGYDLARAAAEVGVMCIFITGSPARVPKRIAARWPVVAKPIQAAEVVRIIEVVRGLRELGQPRSPSLASS